MKLLAKILCTGALLVATTPFARADSANQISFAGGEIFNTTTGSVTFLDFNGAAPGNAYTGFATGIFAPFASGAATFSNFNYLSTAVPFTLITSVVSPTLSAVFNVTNFTYDLINGLTVVGNGNYTLNNAGALTTITNGAFTLTTQGAAGSSVTFSDTNTINAVTPEPNSLMLLGTGLVSAAGMLVRRRRANVIA